MSQCTVLKDAVDFALSHEISWPRSMFRNGVYVATHDAGDREGTKRPVGPVFPRTGPNGLVIYKGKESISWGDTAKPDMVFSITKSFLALLVGVAIKRELIPDIDCRVCESVNDGGFEGEHNSLITWRHLLEQSSEWQGTLFNFPHSINWANLPNRALDVGWGKNGQEITQPGKRYEYNDVRVNRLALSLLRVLKTPLPKVLREAIMTPIGASDDWAWHGYESSWVEVDGHRVQSVSGGGHWGGGIVMSSLDLARIGLLIVQDGRWEGKEVLPRGWVDAMLTPSPCNINYGLLWWINTNKDLYSSVSNTSVFANGAATNFIWVDRDRELVVVSRWLDPDLTDALFGKIDQAFKT